jgi:hypothetical protein
VSESLRPEGKNARNERRKAVAATCNAISVAAAAATALPALLNQDVQPATIVLGIAIFIGMQGALHAVLRGLED